MSEQDKPILIYDDRCGFCQQAVKLVRALDHRKRLRYEGSSNTELLTAVGLTPEEANRELKLYAGGRIWGGYDAVVEALRMLPRTFWLAPPMRLAPVRWVGRRIYRQIAANRKCTYDPGSGGQVD